MTESDRDPHMGEADTADTIAAEVWTVLLSSVVALVVLVLLAAPAVLDLLNV